MPWTEIHFVGAGTKYRLIIVDNPESTNEIDIYGPEASTFTKSLIQGKEVYLENEKGNEKDK